MVPAHNARILALLVLASTALSQDIVFGQSTVLNNSNFFVGEALAIGIKAAFLDANLKGGVLGKNLELYTLDDSNEPAKTINNTLQFVSNSSVFAIIGYTGTSGIQGSLPHVLKTDYPLLGPFSGSLSLRVPFNKQIINLRPSYSGLLF
jgi:ABC-type branched-subunit amino acid transport system substrate-binding protein